MSTTDIKFSPSINILRDIDSKFKYIPTPNSIAVFNQLINDLKGKNKSHIVIGAYGIGKSSLLLAMMQTFSGFQRHFEYKKPTGDKVDYDFIPIIGSYNSFIKVMANHFLINENNYSSKEILKAIDNKYKKLERQQKGLIFIVDEFGKFLEYASKNNPEAELYFLQELAEWVNEANKEVSFIATLHQDFNAYANTLNKNQQQEWDKVKGRFKEVVFNEPVEQLLYLASERIYERFHSLSTDKNLEKLFKLVQQSKVFPLRDYFEIDFAKKIFPFDILSAAILTLALQRYGQNERSLFSFLESNDYLSTNQIQEKDLYFSIDRVYDYLINNFYSVVTSNRTSDYLQWSSVRKALEKAEGVLNEDIYEDAQKVIKAIGLLNIFASAGARLDNEFYENYLRFTMNIKEPLLILNQLSEFKILRYVKHSLRYVIFEGTDLNIDLAINEAGKIVEKVNNVVSQLNQHFSFPFIPAKSIFYEAGMPRFFQFVLSEKPINNVPEGEIDGFINLIFANDADVQRSVKDESAICKEAILYGFYKNFSQIQEYLFEIQKIKQVIADNQNDRVALKYLNEILQSNINLLNHSVIDSLYSDEGNVKEFLAIKNEFSESSSDPNF